MSKLDSVFGGRLVWHDRFLGDGTANSELSLSSRYTYTETTANFTAQRGTTGVTLNMAAADTAGGYVDKQHVRCRYLTIGGNQEMLCKFTGVTGVEQFPIFWLRGNGTVASSPLGAADDTCYYWQHDVQGGILQCLRVSASAQVQVGTNHTFAASASDMWIRCAAVGTNLYSRIWLDSSNEPTSWSTAGGSNTEVPRGSHFGFGFSGGNSGIVTFTDLVKELYVWDLDLSEREAALG